MTSTTIVRDRSGREWHLAPEPPANMRGNLHYGFPVSAQAVDSIVRETFGDEDQTPDNSLYCFWGACRYAANTSRPLYTGVRRDIKLIDIPGHPLHGMVLGIASNKSWKTRILPQKDEIARLKEVLQTDEEPAWFPVL